MALNAEGTRRARQHRVKLCNRSLRVASWPVITMKTSTKILSLFALAALAAVSLAKAADPAPAPAGPPADGARPAIRQMLHRRLEMLTEKLNLTEDQRTKIKGIWKQAGEQGRALRDDMNLTRGDFRTKAEALKKSAHEQVRAVLTPEQQTIFDKLPADGPGRGDGRRHKAKEKSDA